MSRSKKHLRLVPPDLVAAKTLALVVSARRPALRAGYSANISVVVDKIFLAAGVRANLGASSAGVAHTVVDVVGLRDVVHVARLDVRVGRDPGAF